MIVDFHSHTSESDGTLNPQALADFMGERGVEVFSISDHDTLSAYGKFTPPPGARVVTGVEINTTYRGNEVHLLGYGMPADSPELLATIERNRDARRVRAQRMVDQLQRAGYGITYDEVLKEAPEAKAIGRPHVAKALIAKGQVPDIDWAFRNLLRSGMPGYVPSLHITPQEAIERISAAGGVPVLAHPGRLKDRVLIDELAPHGLRGLEVFYPLHDAEDVRIFRDLAKRYGLLMTGGMDFHDIRYHTRGVGIDVADDDIAPFLNLIM
ncbi:MAG: PHP domain-containing protein [Candidatus Aquilonibacter sp.]